MATGTSNTEMDDLKEMVRALTNRVDILSAANTDLNTKLVKAKEFTDAQAADLNARLMKSLEQNADLNKRLTENRGQAQSAIVTEHALQGGGEDTDQKLTKA